MLDITFVTFWLADQQFGFNLPAYYISFNLVLINRIEAFYDVIWRHFNYCVLWLDNISVETQCWLILFLVEYYSSYNQTKIDFSRWLKDFSTSDLIFFITDRIFLLFSFSFRCFTCNSCSLIVPQFGIISTLNTPSLDLILN